MDDVERVQHYYRERARRLYETVATGPFDCFFHPSDPQIYFNYAIPRSAVGGDVSGAMTLLRDEFARRGRQPRFEFVERFAPGLAARLTASGFREESHLHVMSCTQESYLAPGPVEGLTLLKLDSRSSLADVTEFLATRTTAFTEIETQSVDRGDIEHFYATVDTARPYLARLHGRPVAVGHYSVPVDGVGEIAGIATVPQARFQGIGGVVTGRLATETFAEGARIAILSVVGERTGRIYERVGFSAFTRMFAFS